MDPLRMFYAPRTHWDLAWWLRQRLFRQLFGGVMDELVAALEREPRLRFTLDGQVELAQWWLEATALPAEHEARHARLRRLVVNGQLQVGPALILPDEFLAPAESLVRNVQLGRQIAEQLGAPTPQALDMSDLFGHPAQMPQITTGFGLSYYLFARGLGNEGAKLNPIFRWESPDGSSVTAVPMQGSYDNGYEFGRTTLATSLGVVDTFLRRYGERYQEAGLSSMLLSGGTDHAGLATRILEDLEACRQQFPDIEFVIGTNEDYVASLLPEELTLPTWRDELSGSRDMHILRGVNSTRMHLKQSNEHLYRLIVAAETACSLASLRYGGQFTYPLEAFRLLWRQFLVLQSHDAVTGCHIDDVTRDMVNMYENLDQVANRLLQEGLYGLMGQKAPQHIGLGEHKADLWQVGAEALNGPKAYPAFDGRHGMPPAAKCSLWNPLPYERSEVALLELPPHLVGSRPLSVRVNGQKQPVQRLGADRAAVALQLGSFGSAQLDLRHRLARATTPQPTSDRVIENDHLRVVVADNGTVTLTELATGRQFTGLHRLESVGDRGDSYTFDPVADQSYDSRNETAVVRRTSNGPLVWELEVEWQLQLPAELDPATRYHGLRRWTSWSLHGVLHKPNIMERQDRTRYRPRWLTRAVRKALRLPGRAAAATGTRRSEMLVTCTVRTVFRLRQGSALLECDTVVDNQAKDHRLRVVFPVGQTVHHSRAETAFFLQSRPIKPPTDPQWKTTTRDMEPPFNEHAHQGVVAVGPMAVFSRGLPEYEAYQGPNGTEVALTLLRAIGCLSEPDLTTRHGGAGPSLPIPGAQCLGELRASYAIGFAGEAGDTELMRASQTWRNQPIIGPAGLDTNGLLQLDGAWVFSALKGAENGSGIVARVFAGPTETSFSSQGEQPIEAQRLRLDESPIENDAEVRPYQIATFRLS